MNNWFETLAESLKSENITGWPITQTINYGETIKEFIDDKNVSIYRSDTGRYERPIHYKSLKI